MEHLLVVVSCTGLVKDTEHFVQAVVDLTMQARYLDDDTIMSQTLNKSIGQSFAHFLVIVVVSTMANIKNRLLYVAHFVPKDIDGNRGVGKALLTARHDVFGIGVLHAQVLAET